MTLVDVVSWETLLDEAGAVVLDETGDPVLVPMYAGYTINVVEVNTEDMVAAADGDSVETLTTWETLLDEAGATVLDEAGDAVLVPTTVDAPVVETTIQDGMVTADVERGHGVVLTEWKYLLAESGDYIVTEGGDRILIPVTEAFEAAIVEASTDSSPVTAGEV